MICLWSIKTTNVFKLNIWALYWIYSTLSFNDHIKLVAVLGVFSRERPALTLEAAVYAAMVLPILDYCDVLWHESGQGNDKVVERLLRHDKKELRE